MCKGASKQSSDLKNYTALGLRPCSKIPGSATDADVNLIDFRSFNRLLMEVLWLGGIGMPKKIARPYC